MSDIKIKICGLKSLEDISYVNEFHPDYIGFVFAGSKRKVTKELARQLKSNLDDSILATGVFVNEALENVIDLCEANIIDVVQLHGDEDITYIKRLKESIDKPVIKAVRVKDFKAISDSQIRDYKTGANSYSKSADIAQNNYAKFSGNNYNKNLDNINNNHFNEADFINDNKELYRKDIEKEIMEEILQASRQPFDYILLDTYTPSEYGGSGRAFDRKLIPPMQKPFFLAGGIGADNVIEAIMECHPYGIDVSSSVENEGKKDKEKIKELISIIRNS